LKTVGIFLCLLALAMLSACSHNVQVVKTSAIVPNVEQWKVADSGYKHGLKFTRNIGPDGMVSGGVIYYTDPRATGGEKQQVPFVKYWFEGSKDNFYTAMLLDNNTWFVGDRGEQLSIARADEGLTFQFTGKNSHISRFIRK
jgi:hypothetical protein